MGVLALVALQGERATVQDPDSPLRTVPTQLQSLQVHRLSILDPSGSERIVISAATSPEDSSGKGEAATIAFLDRVGNPVARIEVTADSQLIMLGGADQKASVRILSSEQGAFLYLAWPEREEHLYIFGDGSNTGLSMSKRIDDEWRRVNLGILGAMPQCNLFAADPLPGVSLSALEAGGGQLLLGSSPGGPLLDLSAMEDGSSLTLWGAERQDWFSAGLSRNGLVGSFGVNSVQRISLEGSKESTVLRSFGTNGDLQREVSLDE